MDFALITLKTPVTEGTGYFGIQRGTGDANIDISSVRNLRGYLRVVSTLHGKHAAPDTLIACIRQRGFALSLAAAGLSREDTPVGVMWLSQVAGSSSRAR